MKPYFILLALVIVTACGAPKKEESSSLSHAKDLNNNRQYTKTISLLEKSGDLTVEEEKELIYAYVGSAGFEAVKVQKQFSQIEKLLKDKKIGPITKLKRIFEIIPDKNKQQMESLSAAIQKFEQMQESGQAIDKNSRFQLGTLYTYRAIQETKDVLELFKEDFQANLNRNLTKANIETTVDFINQKLAYIISDIAKSYKQLKNSYKGIQKIAKNLNKTLNFYLDDQALQLAIKNDFNKVSDIINLYIRSIEKIHQNHTREINNIFDSLGLATSFEKMTQTIRENPKKTKLLTNRLEQIVTIFLSDSESNYSKQLELLNSIFPADMIDEAFYELKESIQQKSTYPINQWLQQNEHFAQKIKNFVLALTDDIETEKYTNVARTEIEYFFDFINDKDIEEIEAKSMDFIEQAVEASEHRYKNIQKEQDKYFQDLNEAEFESDTEFQESQDELNQEMNEKESEDDRLDDNENY